MKKVGESFELSATDLVGYLNCHYLAGLDRAVANGPLSKPKVWDPLLQIFEAECRTPRQIQLANAFCRYLEMVKCTLSA